MYTIICPGDQDHYKQGILIDCHSWLCPECYKLHYKKEADAAYEYLEEVKRAYYMQGVDLGLPIHLILSPDPAAVGPLDELTADRYRELSHTALVHLRRIGVVGGVIVTHSVTGTSKAINAHRTHQSPIKHQLHFHIVGWMPSGHRIKSDAFYRATRAHGEAWIYKVIPLRVQQFTTVRRILRYELSHASIPVYDRYKGHVVRYFGVASRNNVKVTVTKVQEPVSCPVCGRQLHITREDVDLGEYLRKVKERRFEVAKSAFDRNVLKYRLLIGPAHPEQLDLVAA